MNARPVVVVALLAIALAFPVAGASHWTLQYSEVSHYAGETREDDDAVINEPGNPLHGRVNHVTYAGTHPGDSSLFLDAIMGNRLGAWWVDGGPDFYAGFATSEFTGRSDFVLPGNHQTSAWYGWWFDLNDDKIIDDIHDTGCAGASCTEDEFRWRGVGSGDALGMIHFTIPNSGSNDISAAGNASWFHKIDMVDRTGTAEVEQGWIGAGTWSWDAPLLMTLQTVVLAGARIAHGSPFVYDFDDPAALWDVDVYAAMSGDVEALYLSTYGDYRRTRSETGAQVAEARDNPPVPSTQVVDDAVAVAEATGGPVIALAEASFNAAVGAIVSLLPTDTVNEAVATVADLVPTDAINGALATLVDASRSPSQVRTTGANPREPNTAFDDYQGRALFGGVGDAKGSKNSYDGYTDGHHFYFDVTAASRTCAGVHARVPGTNIAAQQWLACAGGNRDVLGSFTEERGTGHYLAFAGRAVMWSDLNGDTYLGEVCDPQSGNFDSATNTCSNADYPDPHASSGERVDVCETTSARGGTITLTPMGGTWPGVVVIRDERYATRTAFEDVGHWTVRVDSDPIVLRWEDICPLAARDILFFPTGGTDFPIRVESFASVDGVSFPDLGIETGYEYVRDVDFLAATL